MKYGYKNGLGLGGFTAGFYQVCWDFIKADLLKVLEEFHRTGKIGVNINCTFISLDPKDR